MSPRTFGLIAIFAAALPLIAITDHLTEASSRLMSSIAGTKHVPRRSADDQGSSRDAELMQLTARFPAQSPRMKAGDQLAPTDFLNGELGRQGTKWRVRSITGATAETYDIS